MAIAISKTDLILKKNGPKDDKASGGEGYNPNSKTWSEKVIGSYFSEIISTNPFKVKVSGSYDTSKAPYGGGGDAQHSFESRKKDRFGGQMNTITNSVLKAIYSEKKISPKISEIKITIGVTVTWEVIIQESDDGKAYVGISSRGGAGGALTRKDIDTNVKIKKDALPSEIGETKIDFHDVLDYKNSSADIRQVFFQYTSPTKYPPLPKSNGDAPPSDPEAKVLADKQAAVTKNPKEINAKMTLKKKSGPGELVGVVELNSIKGEVTFDKLQFTEPGEYTISVICDSTQVNSTEFTVKVQASEEILEQASSDQEEPTQGNRPIIAQIDEPTYRLPPMTFPITENRSDDTSIGQAIGNTPFVYYGMSQIKPQDIRKLAIFYDEFVPKCVLIFTDTLGLVNAPDTQPKANSTIEIFLNSGSENIKSIHLRFLIDQKKDNRNGTLTIFGKLDLRDFYKVEFESYQGNSFDVLRELSKKLTLGFNSNITETNDNMRWVRNGVNVEKFIRGVLSKSYISDDSFMAGYIDYYYCFNYVDVEKEYNRNTVNDVAVASTGLNNLENSPDYDKVTPLILSNDKSMNSSPFYFEKYIFKNDSTNQLTSQGATTDSKVYDRVNKRFLKFKVDSLTSENDKLKTLRSDDDVKTNFRTEFTGKLDTDNTHENFLYAVTQNKRNLTNLANIKADIILPNPNFNIYKFQKIRVVFVNEKTTATEPKAIMETYTGDWIVLDISYTYNGNSLKQNLIIARKELGKTAKEIENETTKPDDTNNSEINENPIIEPTNTPVIPNSIYTIGQEVYLEQNGRMYVLVVEKVSDNGIEISGKITESRTPIPPNHTQRTPGPLGMSQSTGMSQSQTSNLPSGDPNIKTKLLSSVGIYNGEGTSIITANAPFLINDTTEVMGIGTASIQPEGVAKQKEMAVKAAEIDAINKYKAQK